MTIRHLRIFIEVANSKSMSRAASKFYISQPTVSQAIAELESHYGAPLFERFSKKLYITDFGKNLLYQARQVVASFDDLEKNMMSSYTKEQVRFGATVTVGTCLINDIIDTIHEFNSNMDVTVHINNTAVIEEKLINNELDIALVEGKIKSNVINVNPIIEDYLVLVCSSKHPFAQRENICIKELENEKFIVREKGSGTRELFEEFMKEYNIGINIAWECNNSEAIKNAVLANRGLSVLSARLVEKEIKNGLVKVVPIKDCIDKKDSILHRKFTLAVHKNKFISPALISVIDAVNRFKDDDISYLLRKQ